ncbi:aryl-sulfate sulfotransferase [Salmonella enterica subsp. enterica]|nr:aryl-sulfate sulfotransferase [Salmonella enterica subsp. enterica]
MSRAPAGRNWAHVNSVESYDPRDDSIIGSSRRSLPSSKLAAIKVKWILSDPSGWKKANWRKSAETRRQQLGKPLTCEAHHCDGGFDWTWTQHTG